MESEHGLYICLISIHGLIRGEEPELGRDADTGGQVRYVLELARALGAHRRVASVDLITRRLEGPGLDPIYAAPIEPLGDGARIVRVDGGDNAYLRKEQLWEHLDALVEGILAHLRDQPRRPDVIHSHYADAGSVGVRVAEALGVPLIHTGHSLGRVKLQRLLDAGTDAADLERDYRISRRIAAEEEVNARADLLVASTRQEVEAQYGLYDRRPTPVVIPPGTDLERFHPPDWRTRLCPAARELERFLTDPDRPIVLVIARPDPRKNLVAHVDAFAGDPRLREHANLVVVAGTRDDIDTLDPQPHAVLTELLLAIDRHDLYGRVAYPKDVSGADVADLFRVAAASGGVHVNAALTEPFGLTLIEAAACGLPVVASQDGGPREILARCGHGLLVDPLDTPAIGAAIAELLFDRARWLACSRAGTRGVRAHFSWEAHAQRYLEEVQALRRAPSARVNGFPRAANGAAVGSA